MNNDVLGQPHAATLTELDGIVPAADATRPVAPWPGSVKPAPAKVKWLNLIEQVFAIDVRSLALLRVCLACLLLLDLMHRSSDIEAFYSDQGLLPRSAVYMLFPARRLTFSVHMLSGSVAWEASLFCLAALFALALLVGYQTRWATALSWFMVVSLQTRNPTVFLGGDEIMRLLLFWSLFLPLGACYSVDRALAEDEVSARLSGTGQAVPEDPQESGIASVQPVEAQSAASNTTVLENIAPQRIFSAATVGILLQVCSIYWFSAAWKTDPVWRHDGTALYYALSIEQYTTRFAQFLLHFPGLLKLLSFGTMGLEWLGPTLILLPSGRLRLWLIGVFISFHIGLALCLKLGLFPLMCGIAWSVFVPTFYWERLSRHAASDARQKVQLYYDGDCSFCRKMGLLVRTFCALPADALRPAQTNGAILAELRAHNSWVIVNPTGQHYLRFEGLAYLLSITPGYKLLASVVRSEPILNTGNALYTYLAGQRTVLGQATSFLRYRPLSVTLAPMLQMGVGFLVVYTLLWNIWTLNRRHLTLLFPAAEWIGEITRLDQQWNTFAPRPRRDDGWYVVPGTLKDGTLVDLFRNGAPLSWDKPAMISDLYKNAEWRYYMMVFIRERRHNKHLRYYVHYLWRQWNREHTGAKRLRLMQVYFMWRPTMPDYQKRPVEPFLLATHTLRVNPAATTQPPATPATTATPHGATAKNTTENDATDNSATENYATDNATTTNSAPGSENEAQ